MAAANGLVTNGDQISKNTVTDPSPAAGSSWNCGYGVTAASGIVVAVAAGSDVSGNKVTDTRATSTTKAAVQFGISSGRGVTVKTSTTSPNVGVPGPPWWNCGSDGRRLGRGTCAEEGGCAACRWVAFCFRCRVATCGAAG